MSDEAEIPYRERMSASLCAVVVSAGVVGVGIFGCVGAAAGVLGADVPRAAATVEAAVGAGAGVRLRFLEEKSTGLAGVVIGADNLDGVVVRRLKSTGAWV